MFRGESRSSTASVISAERHSRRRWIYVGTVTVLFARVWIVTPQTPRTQAGDVISAVFGSASEHQEGRIPWGRSGPLDIGGGGKKALGSNC